MSAGANAGVKVRNLGRRFSKFIMGESVWQLKIEVVYHPLFFKYG
jgi:hypothetical protein